MKRFSAILFAGLLLTVSCAKESSYESTTTTGENAVEQTASKTYEMEGNVVSRDEAAKTFTIDHGPIGDWMGAMTMTFPVRGAEFSALPQKGTHIKATVHVAESGDYWITDVVETPAEETMESEPTEGDPMEEAPAGEGSAEGQEVNL